MTYSLAEQAALCRAQAGEFAGRPEQPFLLRLSEAFDDLARQQQLVGGVQGKSQIRRR